jgi:hypothetical protein
VKRVSKKLPVPDVFGVEVVHAVAGSFYECMREAIPQPVDRAEYFQSLSYNTLKRTGKLMLHGNSCTDMQGVIKLFTLIDPKVRRIETYNETNSPETQADTVYRKSPNGEWKGYNPR